jgi:hypothetical protein
MKNYRIHAVMVGVLYFLGTAFGIMSTIVGGEVLSSIITHKPLPNLDLLDLVATNSFQLLGGSFLILLMGISLVAMTVFLYPIIKKDSEELAMGMLLFRGALEGAWYSVSALGVLVLITLGNEYVAVGSNPAYLQSMGKVVYRLQGLLGPVGTILFLIGATCLYISFFRTRLIPRWLTVWGLIGVVPYMVYALLKFFNVEHGMLFYLQMVLAPQEIVMALWLIVKGFDRAALERLMNN